MYHHVTNLKRALKRLQSDLDEKLVGFNLMSETFTMGPLQKLYEAIQQREFVRTNFQRKMPARNILERLEKQYNGKSHKAPQLYRFIKINLPKLRRVFIGSGCCNYFPFIAARWGEKHFPERKGYLFSFNFFNCSAAWLFCGLSNKDFS